MVIKAMAESFEKEWAIFSDVMFDLYLQEFMTSKVFIIILYIIFTVRFYKDLINYL
jgi:hypothetical protein